jgi:hypothetical protein
VSDLVAGFFGARGQGKTSQVREYLEATRPARILAFDPMRQFPELELTPSLEQLLERLQAAGSGAFAYRYAPPIETVREVLVQRFEAFCQVAYAFGRLDLVVDELGLVTRPSWSPPKWKMCTLTGRHVGLRILATAQRPALVDKDFFSNCTAVSTCRLNFADDVAVMSNVLGVDRARILGLAQFQYIARDMSTGQVEEGRTRPPAPARPRRRAGSQK